MYFQNQQEKIYNTIIHWKAIFIGLALKLKNKTESQKVIFLQYHSQKERQKNCFILFINMMRNFQIQKEFFS